MAYHPTRIDRLGRGSTYLIVSEGQPADEYTVPVGTVYHVEPKEGDVLPPRWEVRIKSNNPNGSIYDTPGPERGQYFRSWQEVVEFADAAVAGHWHGRPVDLIQPSSNDIVAWARQTEHDTVIRYDGLAIASEMIRKRRERETDR